MNKRPFCQLAGIFVLTIFSITARAGDHRPFTPFGKWRGLFQLKDSTQVPFNFEITGRSQADVKIFFLNAEEKFDGGRVTWNDDSLFIHIDQFDNELVFAINGKKATGVLRRQDNSGNSTPVTAEQGITRRFTVPDVKAVGKLEGTYDVRFSTGKGEDEKAVGLFTQKGNQLKATFLRITGDSRYLEGTVSGNRFYLSSFIGSSPVYYTGTLSADGSFSGSRGSLAYKGVPDENASLPDAYKLTYLKDGYSTLDFTFPNLDGKPVSLKDEKYKNKVVVVTIGGTWCPNCIDEAAFLAPWYKKNRQRGVEIIALHYERTLDTAYVNKMIRRFNNRFGIEYDELFAGVADKQNVAASLPALNTFLSFPTTIFIDRQGKVAKIHTGYTGPATGKYYDEFVREFNADIDGLLK
ncbi:MAG: TlpA family protein disulfide reductase [Chitinophagaceae bacterium]|nr:MAG: TlpA family protein disulfide reductase [Chitinophagaceae bacterium]